MRTTVYAHGDSSCAALLSALWILISLTAPVAMSSLSRSFLIVGFGLIASLSACGDPTDRPQDCSSLEYYDEVDRLCVSCPALTEPDCREGFGYVIQADERDCPAVSCAESVTCPEGQEFSLETLSCEVVCGASEYVGEDGACAQCPDDSPTSCDDEGCACTLASFTDEVTGCAYSACRSCSAPTEGFTVNTAGECIAE